MSNKRLCKECGWHGTETEVLTAPNPFEEDTEITGCPACLSVESMAVACDAADCWNEICCGTPTPTGYRTTCYNHRPDIGT
jgi:hypothetical protein